MTRRVAAGFGRLLPPLLIAAAVVIVIGAALMGGCGSPSPSPTATVTVTASASGTAQPTASPTGQPTASASPTAPAAVSVIRLYFLRGAKLGVAERRVPRTTAVATASLQALLKGPSNAERTAGLTSAIPTDTRLLRLSVAGGAAKVDLSAEFTADADAAAMGARVAEVVYTLTRFSTVRSVQLTVDGAVVDTVENVDLGEPQTRADWRDLEPIIFVESPGVGAVLTNPFTLSGTASVFEGSFQARLQDASGRRVVLVTVQATRGAPGRGRFSRVVPYSTSARSGTLIVFDRSMEDGSVQDEVRIPVTFGK